MRRRRLYILVLAALAVVLLLVWGADHHLRNFHAVEPGVLYRSGQLTPAGLKFALRWHRIRTVVSLRTVRDPGRPYPDGWEEDVCAAAGARHVRILPRVWAVDEAGGLPGAEAVREFRAVMADPANHPVLVHCFAGVHRTGAMCAAYRIGHQGWGAGRAIAEMEGYGFAAGPGREPIEVFLRGYPTGRGHETPGP